MAKLAISTSLICVLLAIIANAVSGYLTATAITVEMEDAYRVQGICKKEAEKKDLSSCENYVRLSRTRSEETPAIRRIGNRQQQVPGQCCNQAWKLSGFCRCQSIRYLPEKQGYVGSQEYDEAMRRADDIISVCFDNICPR
ncbi:hypothetical protein JCGZ_00815 [Jatropha curcas]|uniref:Uncharacterized protein n=1 Tax=Jatropha curcas TaxID=180498 RepID=A0A067KVN3_JATCU|nr:2S albumin [Jatropha curcas]KDP39058.1 hypothetical protein JCGZ_00815 [Jatropha curcas]